MPPASGGSFGGLGGLGGMAPAPALGGTGLAGGTTGSGLGMPGLQGTGLDAQGDKGFVKLSTDPATLHQAFHYADIAATRLQQFFLVNFVISDRAATSGCQVLLLSGAMGIR